MIQELPASTEIVVIGGGIVGCSVLYHLSKAGVENCILLEKHQISSGTTWHSAALVTPLRPSAPATELARYSAQLYASLEKDTGQATGWRQCGHLNIAASPERLQNLKRTISMSRSFGIDVELIGPGEIKRKWPLLNTDDLFAGIWMPSSGRVDPTDVCQAFLKGARSRGAKVFENTSVEGFDIASGAIRGVRTPLGEVRCEAVVNCTGVWGRELAAGAGVTAPLFACEHFYLLTEQLAGVHSMLPVVRDGDAFLYIREEVGGLLIGCFEPNPKPLPLEKLPQDSSFVLLNEDWDHFEPMMRNAIHRIPALATVGARKLINGPESFTPDHNPLLGESAEVRGFYLACGMNSSGIGSAGGIGWAIAELITTGRSPVDISASDVRRFQPYQNNLRALSERVPEVLAEHFAIPWPNMDYVTVRGVRRSPFHDQLKHHGAYFTQRGGWERPLFFDSNGPRVPDKAYDRQNYFELWRAEHEAARHGVAIFDQTPFGKLLVQGSGAERFLQRVCANDVCISPGNVIYTALLNQDGGIESDITVTKLDQLTYLLITGSQQARRDADWLRRNIRDELVVLTDMTSAYATLAICGPVTRELLSRVTSAELNTSAFPFGTMQQIEVGYAIATAIRISYAGELGWELYIPADLAAGILETILDASAGLPVRLAGSAALASLRIEKGFRSWGHDIGPRDTPFEAGLMFAVKMNKTGDFLGREALMRKSQGGMRRRLLNFLIEGEAAFPYAHEPIYRGGRLCGALSSASFGHSVGGAVGLGWVKDGDLTDDGLARERFEIEIAGERFKATAFTKALYDPGGTRMRA